MRSIETEKEAERQLPTSGGIVAREFQGISGVQKDDRQISPGGIDSLNTGENVGH